MILSFNIYISHKREFLVSSVGSKKLKLLELLEWYFYNVSLFFFFFSDINLGHLRGTEPFFLGCLSFEGKYSYVNF